MLWSETYTGCKVGGKNILNYLTKPGFRLNQISNFMNIIIADSGTIVEDQFLNTLNQYNPDWNISVSTSKMQCLEKVKKANNIDLVILGQQLSDVSGFDMIDLIRDDSDIPIIYLSDDKDIHALVRAFDKGATDYIVMPFSNKVFLARLNAIIRRRMWDLKIEGDNHFTKTTIPLSGGSAT